MITCSLRYVIDPYKLENFEKYAKMWISLINKFCETHHGYFFPRAEANNIALTLFSFPNLAAYEEYREKIKIDPDCQKAFAHAEKSRYVISYERSLIRPVFSSLK